jgi:hypothetical protein
MIVTTNMKIFVVDITTKMLNIPDWSRFSFVVLLTCGFLTWFGLLKTLLNFLVAVLVMFLCLATFIPFVGGKAASAKLIAYLLPFAMDSVDRRFRNIRKELMKSIHGQVLDFGSGAGANLKYCLLSGKVVSVMALEPNKNLIPKLTKVMADLAKYHVGTPMPRWEICSNFVQDVPGSEIFDWIILGNVLCEVALSY